MNRPYGAVDISANLKGAVPKTATQKILVSLAEGGQLVMKTYGEKRMSTSDDSSPSICPSFLLLGKSTFFVANQANLECMSDDKFSALEQEHNEVDNKVKIYATEIKSLTTGACLLHPRDLS
jgi:26S proteasome regulatory subunit, ATPase 3, interacting protein